jgi:hypothetical protein
MEKKETEKMGELASRISTLNALLGIEVDGQPYFSVSYLKKMVKLTQNEMRMMKIANIFYDE